AVPREALADGEFLAPARRQAEGALAVVVAHVVEPVAEVGPGLEEVVGPPERLPVEDAPGERREVGAEVVAEVGDGEADGGLAATEPRLRERERELLRARAVGRDAERELLPAP